MTAAGEIRHDLVLVGAAMPMSRCSAPGPCAPCRASGSPWWWTGPRPSTREWSRLRRGPVPTRGARDGRPPAGHPGGRRFIVTPAVGLDPRERLVHVAGRPPLRYDTAAFDVGSTVAGLAIPACASTRWPRGPSGASWSTWTRSWRGRASAGAAAWWRWAPARAAWSWPSPSARGSSARACARPRCCCWSQGRACCRAIPRAPRAGWRRTPARAASRSGWARAWPRRARRSWCWRTARASRSTPSSGWQGRRACRSSTRRAWRWTSAASCACGGRSSSSSTTSVFAVGDCASLEGRGGAGQGRRLCGAPGARAHRQSPRSPHGTAARALSSPARFLSLLNLGDGRAIASKWG